MHPLIADRRKLILYMAAWVPLELLGVGLLVMSGASCWPRAAGLIVPLVHIYAVMCLSAWYICRYVPLGGPGIRYLLVAVIPAAAIVSLIWSAGIAWALALAAGLQPLYLRYRWPLFGAGVLLYAVAVAFHYVLIALESSRQAAAREMEARVLAREAELRSLKSQINPHFLFNCLNSISALTTSEPAKAREMCVLLSDFLRSSLGVGDHDRISLREELALARNFLAIQSVRFSGRLRVDEEIEAGLQAWPVPPLILQPLVENAVTHGVSTLVEGSTVRLEARRAGVALGLAVENAFDPDAPKSRRRGGVGLANVRKRLAARYGGEARVDVLVNGGRFRVELLVPAAEEGK